MTVKKLLGGMWMDRDYNGQAAFDTDGRREGDGILWSYIYLLRSPRAPPTFMGVELA